MRPASSVALGVGLTQDLLSVHSKPITQDNSSGQQLAKPNLLVFELAQLFVYLLYGVHCIAGGLSKRVLLQQLPPHHGAYYN